MRNRMAQQVTQRIQPNMVTVQQDFGLDRETIIQRVRNYTMTSTERINYLISAVHYITVNKLPGPIVECGVWKGGSMMTAALTLLKMGDTSRDLYLYDTFDGMPGPDDIDVRYDGEPASNILAGSEKTTENVYWAYSPIDAVKCNLLSTGYPEERLHFIKGKVEDTIPDKAPE